MDIDLVTFLQQKIVKKFEENEVFKELSIDQKNTLIDEIKQKLKADYPVDYILGEVEFLDLKLAVKEGVFLPREETQWWILEIVKAKLKQKSIFQKDLTNQIFESLCILDVASGSGVVGLSLAKYFESVLAVEKNLLPFGISRENANRNKLWNYRVFCSNLITNKLLRSRLNSQKKWILCTNLPYVPQSDFGFKDQNKLTFEPKTAIYSGWDGLSHFRLLIKQIAKLPNPPTAVFFELDPRNIAKAGKIVKNIYTKTKIYKDQSKNPRLLVGWI